MASYGQISQKGRSAFAPPSLGHKIPAIGPGGAPIGTFSPGTKIQVGSHRVVIQKYLSEGGFAHVYLVKLPNPIDGTDFAVLKRVAVPDKEALKGMRTEVETMKRLKGHVPIVTYMDSHASELNGGGYEVFLLMEYCNGGGLIDFMNTRLQHRLTEPEILNIFADIAEGVACMHYLKPSLLHRDLKVENVLITSKGNSKRFKLCDFGSASPPRSAPTTVVECRLMDEDVQKHTTLQYRSPEMVDVYRKQPINEKSDIWALGVLLYKLCYYTTPFEDQGQLAILNASFKYPSHPNFSNRMKKLIASMLRENLSERPNIYEVLKEACTMQGRELPIKDIYSGQDTRSTVRDEHVRPPVSNSREPQVGASFSPPTEETPALPTVIPMRRGRPTASLGPKLDANRATPQSSASTAAVTKGDPFAALDTKEPAKGHGDEFTSRFPSLDQFSLLHDRGDGFDFESTATGQTSSITTQTAKSDSVQKFAGEVSNSTARQLNRSKNAITSSATTPNLITSNKVTALPNQSQVTSESQLSRASAIIKSNPELQTITSQCKYVSTGTSTADLPATEPRNSEQDVGSTRFSLSRPSSQIYSRGGTPHIPTSATTNSLSLPKANPYNTSPSVLPSKLGSISGDIDELPLSASSSRYRQRPLSARLDGGTKDEANEKSAIIMPNRESSQLASPPPDAGNVNNASSKTTIGKYRLQLDDAPLNKPISVGKIGGAYKKFGQDSVAELSQPIRKAEAFPLVKPVEHLTDHTETKVGESQASDLSPEQRREVERQMLEREEQRVEAGQAAYRRRVIDGRKHSVPESLEPQTEPRASSIQERVQNLLNEEQRAPAVQRTAHGYGKYSDSAIGFDQPKAPPQIRRKPIATTRTPINPESVESREAISSTKRTVDGTSSAPPAIGPKPSAKPAAPKKPVHLNSLPTGQRPPSPAKRSYSTRLEQLVANDLPGQPILDMTAQEKDDYVQDFSKRFPSLSSIEMAATSTGAGRRSPSD